MVRTRYRRRALSENDINNISEVEKLDIISRYKSWNSQVKKQRELLETEFKCPICLELIVKATLAVSKDVKDGIARRCGHTFCEDCINTSMESSDKCPLCQSKIFLTIPNHEVESLLNLFLHKYFSNDAKTARANLLKQREEDKIKSLAEAENRIPAYHVNAMNTPLDQMNL